MFNLKIHAKKEQIAFSILKFIEKKAKMKKKESTFVHFLHFKSQNSCKKRLKGKKKFQI